MWWILTRSQRVYQGTCKYVGVARCLTLCIFLFPMTCCNLEILHPQVFNGRVVDEQGQPLQDYRVGAKRGLRTGADIWETAWRESATRVVILPGPPDLAHVCSSDGSFQVPIDHTGDFTLFIEDLTGRVHATEMRGVNIVKEDNVIVIDLGTFVGDNGMAARNDVPEMTVQVKRPCISCTVRLDQTAKSVSVFLARGHGDNRSAMSSVIRQFAKSSGSCYSVDSTDLASGEYTVLAIITAADTSICEPQTILQHIVLD